MITMVPLPNVSNPLIIDEDAREALSKSVKGAGDDKPGLIPASDESSASDASSSTKGTVGPRHHHRHNASSSSLTLEDSLRHGLVRSLSLDDEEYVESKKVECLRRTVSLGEVNLRRCLVGRSGSEDTFSLESGPVSPRGAPEELSEEGSVPASLVSCDQEEPSKGEKHVRWGSLEIRKYPIIPGIHPDCVAGPPVRTSLLRSVGAVLFHERT